jgi:hypothetical protein
MQCNEKQGVAGVVLPEVVWAADLSKAGGEGTGWLWEGFLARGHVTLLTSQWKSGKTTLLAILLSKFRNGGVLAGRPVTAAKAVVVSEESAGEWKKRGELLDFGNSSCFFCRPFPGKPTHEQWLALMDRLAILGTKDGVNLAVIDSLTTFLPGRDENHAPSIIEAMMPWQRLTKAGMSVLAIHHPKKGKTLPGQAARGSGALACFVDTVVEMTWFGRSVENDRRRRLQSFSRFPETPRQLVMELNREGTDYVALGDFHEEEFLRGWEQLRAVLEDANQKLTRREVQAEWPADFEPVTHSTLWRWLDQAVGRGLVLREGTGRKNSPFRYWLPGQEKKFPQKPPPFTDFAAWEKWFFSQESGTEQFTTEAERPQKGIE